MTDTVRLTLESLRALTVAALRTAGAHDDAARSTAEALVTAEADGLASHGVARVPHYVAHLRCGMLDGRARPEVHVVTSALVRVDARHGLAYPAITAGLARAFELVRGSALTSVAITRSHHCGALGYHLEGAARRGLVALAFSNSPAAIAPWGGARGSFGTNPIAFACPRESDEPILVDLSLSQVARGRVMVAARRGEPIPEGWALDDAGAPTEDPAAALAGTMAPLGGAKGAALALMVELLAAAVTGSNFAGEASSFFTTNGPPPGIGQLLLILDPARFSGGDSARFIARVELLAAGVLAQHGARLPGARRFARRARARRDGVTLDAELHAELTRLARR
ncbi:MAG: Ldh family oxidoreductase [Myxococcales bacterium]|nr:Ldh family oxidoreductase [Myxococcales bacterium]